MAQQNRQVRMFAAEDYMAVYDSYINANFKAFDFDTIRESMVTYIQAQYPENFNDWIESSDFVALLDVIAQFGHNFAFRNDLNSRNNFLSTAQRQDSVFKLAEFLGYIPRRNIPAAGQLKIISVKTNEGVLGSDGNTLAGKTLRYESISSNDTIDDFITVMNAVFNINNQFGNPRKTASISGVEHHFYNLNNLNNQIVFEFTGVAQGTSKPFNIIGLDYNTERGVLFENTPDPANAFSLVYKNDGRGLGSSNTGFFAGFKQGSLSFKDFNINSPISSLTLDVNVNDINNGDVWVETIDDQGNVITKWTSVESVYGFNEIYNDTIHTERNIFAVKTRADNQVSVMFPDESFGNLPQGIIRVWYRTGFNQTYALRPDDIGNKSINIKYQGIDGNTYTVTVGLLLQSNVTNASSSESLDSIKQNAPRAYSAQNRMITAQDYNNYLITQSEQIAKVKSVNRTHSGHSRYINPTDPTGKYTNLRLFATDGTITASETIIEDNTNNLTARDMFDRFISPLLNNQELVNLYYHKWKTTFETDKASDATIYKWQPIDNTSGYFVNDAPVIVSNATGFMKNIQVGSLVKLTEDVTGAVTWAKVSNISNDGLGVDNANGTSSGLNHRGAGAITFDTEIKTVHTLTMAYMPFPRKFTTAERDDIIAKFEAKTDFIIYYDHVLQAFATLPVTSQIKTDAFPLSFTNEGIDSWLIYCTSNDPAFDISTRVVKYGITSDQIEFTNITNEYNLDYHTKKKKRDNVSVVINNVEYSNFYIYGYNYDNNGIFYSNSVNLVLEDGDNDGRPDNPEVYYNIANELPSMTNLRFEWTHVPDNNEIIDPGFSNIIDAFVLTRSYDTEFRNWLIKTDNNLLDAPLAPTTNELTAQFNTITDKKSLSDTVIYNPVKYKILFGIKATEDARASFSVITSPTSSITDNEIKSRIVESIYSFFTLDNWDFGETFYFTELAAYVHKELAGEISSFVIVPESANSVFGKLFQITPMSDELFIPDVSLTDIEIVSEITSENIKATGN